MSVNEWIKTYEKYTGFKFVESDFRGYYFEDEQGRRYILTQSELRRFIKICD